MNDQFTHMQVPARIADLAFTFQMPGDFNALPLPEDKPEFDRPEYFLPLFICMASYGVVVFSVAGRPAYEDGAVAQWAEFLCKQNQIQLEQLQAVRINGMPGILADGVQQADGGLMRARIFFAEDGQRLITATVIAPAQIWNSVEGQLDHMLGSFKLDRPKGPTAVVSADVPSGNPLEAPAQDDLMAQIREGIVTEDPRLVANDPNDTTPPATADEPTRAADVALADDAASLDPDHPTNARLRDGGVGLVPRVIHVDTSFKYAVLGAGAIESTFRLPLGWHCIDDGRRTLVFDAGGKIQVNLNLRATEGESHEAMLSAILSDYQKQQPDVPHLMLELAGMKLLGLRDVNIDGEVLDQAFFIRDIGRERLVLVCRVTAGREDMVQAMNVAEVILRDLQHQPIEQPEQSSGEQHPQWWREAMALEKAGRPEEAEKLILSSVNHLGAYASAAQLYMQRMVRLLKQGDRAAAADAKNRARAMITQYAAGATSGGEGAALSDERDRFIEALEAAFGRE